MRFLIYKIHMIEGIVRPRDEMMENLDDIIESRQMPRNGPKRVAAAAAQHCAGQLCVCVNISTYASLMMIGWKKKKKSLVHGTVALRNNT